MAPISITHPQHTASRTSPSRAAEFATHHGTLILGIAIALLVCVAALSSAPLQ